MCSRTFTSDTVDHIVRIACVCVPRDASLTSLDPCTQTLLDMPTEVLSTICAFCDVSTKMVRPGPSVLHVLFEHVCASIAWRSDLYLADLF